jgi:hypothetical protein
LNAAHALRERVVLASALQEPGAELPPNVARALDFPEAFTSPELGRIARAFRMARSNGEPCSLLTIGKHLDSEGIAHLMQLANESGSALPLDLAEIEAAQLVEVFRGCRIVATLGEGYQAAKADPSHAAAIGEHIRGALAKLDDEAAQPVSEAVPIGDLQRQEAGDQGELILSRFLCRLCALLLCGPTGIGKSSLLIQLLLLFALGRPAFGLRPSRPLKSLLIQAENDDGDIAEMRDGILRGLHLTEAERVQAIAAVRVYREDTHTGPDFCRSVVRPLLKKHKPDLLAIDPALAYIGGQSKEQGDVTPFLRNGLNPLLREFDCGLIMAHHTNKPPTGREKSNWQAGDFAYLGAGSAEWANWPRAILALRSVGSHDVFELLAPKRGGRIGWKDADGNPAYQKFLAHSKEAGVICWTEATPEEVPVKGRPRSYDVAEMLALLPPEGLPAGEWQKLSKSDWGISEASFHRERRALEKAGRVIRSKLSGKWQPTKSA